MSKMTTSEIICICLYDLVSHVHSAVYDAFKLKFEYTKVTLARFPLNVNQEHPVLNNAWIIFQLSTALFMKLNNLFKGE